MKHFKEKMKVKVPGTMFHVLASKGVLVTKKTEQETKSKPVGFCLYHSADYLREGSRIQAEMVVLFH